MLLAKKVTVPAKYLDFTDIFLEKSANVLLEQIEVNKHNIMLKKGKQPLYRPVESLGLVELKTLKTYIKTNLANGFIQASKLPAGPSILFVHKSNTSFGLYVNDQELNNLTIKN